MSSADRPTANILERHTPNEPTLDDLLSSFYNAVSRATALGYFRGRHGPLEETAWLHVVIRRLDDLDRAGAAVLAQDMRGLARLRVMLDTARFESPRPVALAAEGGAQVLKHREPAVVAASALLLDRLTGKSGFYADKAGRYYAALAGAAQQALDRGAIVASRDWPADRLSAFLADINPLSTGQHGGHGDGGGAHSHETGVAMDAATGRSHPVAVEVANQFAEIEHLASHAAQSAHLAMTATCHCDSLSAASRQSIEALAGQLLVNEAMWRSFLERGAPRPDPLHAPAPERKSRCVPGQPQHGGRWDLAALQVTETDKLCPLGQALHDAGARIYAEAGADLIRAQNEVVNAQQCFDEAGNKASRCLKQEDRGYEKCTEERDLGYEHCTREEDRGYRDCCNWIPCSWACKAWTWIKKIVCVAKEWIENIVCVATTWIKNLVCVAWTYAVAVGCAMGHLAKAAFHTAKGLGGIALGASLKTAGNMVGSLCKWINVKPSTRRADALKVVGVHVAVLHTNKVLLFSYDEGVYPVSADRPADFTAIADSDRSRCAVWDLASGTAKYIEPNRNLFCGHQCFTAEGRLLVAGGQFPLPGLLKTLFPPTLLAPGADKDVHTFDPVTERWSRLPDMDKGRWYPTTVTLPDGRVLITSGTNGYATEAGFGRGIQDTWEMVDPATGQVGPPMPFGFHLYHLYPFQHVLPSGEVFIHFKRTTLLFDPSRGTLRRVAPDAPGSPQPQPAIPPTGNTVFPFSRTGGGPGTCVLLPLLPSVDATTGTVTYPAGRILILGGGGAEKEPEPADPSDDKDGDPDTTPYGLHSDTPATRTAEILDFADPNPAWRMLGNSMSHGRVMPDSVLLPNARVLVVGGGRFGQSGGLLAHFTSTDLQGKPDKGATEPVFEPEMFDPVTERWEELCPKNIARLYHTTAVLLPDARVLVAGHDGALNMPPYDASRYELEVFSPPYLFTTDGQLASRPVVAAAPQSASLGERFSIQTPQAPDIASVVLIRQSSTTHQINSDQRLVGLAIAERDRHHVRVTMPTSGGVAPPGFYMLFIVDGAGVPSIAHWLKVSGE